MFVDVSLTILNMASKSKYFKSKIGNLVTNGVIKFKFHTPIVVAEDEDLCELLGSAKSVTEMSKKDAEAEFPMLSRDMAAEEAERSELAKMEEEEKAAKAAEAAKRVAERTKKAKKAAKKKTEEVVEEEVQEEYVDEEGNPLSAEEAAKLEEEGAIVEEEEAAK